MQSLLPHDERRENMISLKFRPVANGWGARLELFEGGCQRLQLSHRFDARIRLTLDLESPPVLHLLDTRSRLSAEPPSPGRWLKILCVKFSGFRPSAGHCTSERRT